MSEERMVKKVFKSEVNCRRNRGRPKRSWMDGVKEALRKREMSVEEARMIVGDRDRWKDVVRMV